MRLEDADKETALLKALAENKFLSTTEGGASPKQFDTEEREYKKRLLDIEKQNAEQKLVILKESHQQESKEYIEQQNRILKIKADTRALEQAQSEADAKEGEERTSKRINAEITQLEEANAREEGVLKVKFAQLIISEQDFALAKLNFKRAMIQEEIKLLEEGGEKEKAAALKKGVELAEIDADIELQKIENKKRTLELEKQLTQTKTDIAKDALQLGIELLSADEEARKKHASAIKAFEIGKIWVNLFSEIQAVWKNANSSPLNILFPGAGVAIATAQTALATGRAIAATAKVSKQKFARGGFTSSLGLDTDETGEEPAGIVHAGEWVANRKFVSSNPDLFKQLNRIQYTNSSVAGLNLLPKQNLYIPQYAVVNSTATYTPQGAYASDNSERLLAAFLGFKSDIAQWQKELTVTFSYQEYKKFENRLNTDFINSNI